MNTKKKILTRNIWIISLVSLFTDVSSEMLYPVMPLYLSAIGFSAVGIGILEGVAEAVAGLSKGYFGKMSDQYGRRMPFVKLGYAFSALSKPLMAVWTLPLFIFLVRSVDRLGKGLRTGARDALLSDECLPEHKGRVFGFHRGMDTLGAALGPMVALAYLHYHPGEYREMFLLAFVPALLGVLFTFAVKEKKHDVASAPKKNPFFSYFGYWRQAAAPFRTITGGLLAFALFNSSDAFLIMMMKHNGLSAEQIILAYVFYNLVFAAAAYPAGLAADALGYRGTIASGLLVYAAIYLLFPYAHHMYEYLLLLGGYGLYAAATEGIGKAWISRVSPKAEAGTALGFFASAGSLAAIISGAAAGLLWEYISPAAPFYLAAAGALALAGYFIFLVGKSASGRSV